MCVWADKKPQWVKALAVRTDKLTSVPRSHMMEGENWFLQAVL